MAFSGGYVEGLTVYALMIMKSLGPQEPFVLSLPFPVFLAVLAFVQP